jgi:hypothetical protein
MYVFDDAIVFVAPPASVRIADAASLAIGKWKAANGPSFTGEGAVKTVTTQYVKHRKFKDIVAFSRQFGEAGFSDPRITSTMLATQLERTQRLPHDEIERIGFELHPGGAHPHISIDFSRAGNAPPIKFLMRYRMATALEAHATLAMVLGDRVASLTPY